MISDTAKAIAEIASEMEELLKTSNSLALLSKVTMDNCYHEMRRLSNKQEVISLKLGALQDTLRKLEYEGKAIDVYSKPC